MLYNRDSILEDLKQLPLWVSSTFGSDDCSFFMEAMGDDFNKKYYYEYGASKFVLIPTSDTLKYVIKIPFSGSSEEGTWEDFVGAENSTRPWDYCLTELERFNEAKAKGFADYFAEIKLLDFIHDYPVYIQEKAITLASCQCSVSQVERNKTNDICKALDFTGIDRGWLTDVRLYYGEYNFIKFIRFINNNSWCEDLHNDNIGYIDNKPVLIDYSGFWV